MFVGLFTNFSQRKVVTSMLNCQKLLFIPEKQMLYFKTNLMLPKYIRVVSFVGNPERIVCFSFFF
jgi:hypothetical protein